MDPSSQKIVWGVLVSVGVALTGSAAVAFIRGKFSKRDITTLIAGLVVIGLGLWQILTPSLIEVPNLANLSQDEAFQKCVSYGLKLETAPKLSDRTPEGRVVPDSQNPATGMKVAPGAIVRAVISLGPTNMQPSGWTLFRPASTDANVWEEIDRYPQARGKIVLDGATFNLSLEGMPANSSFILTINGIPGQPGNDSLAEQGATTPSGEGYVDLQPSLNTQGGGTANVRLESGLKPGRYVAKLILKIEGNNFPMVLQNRRVDFTISGQGGASISLFEPCAGGGVQCIRDAAGVYHFSVRGTSTSLSSAGNSQLLLWVRPVNPPAERAGWYLQQAPDGLQVVHGDGSWEGRCQIGSAAWPPHQGDTIDLAVTVVDQQTANNLMAGSVAVVQTVLPQSIAVEEARGIKVRF